MSYHTIQVDDKTYEYTIGKKFLKFRGGSLVPIEKIGYPVDYISSGRFMVTPGSIIEHIRQGHIYLGLRHCNNYKKLYGNRCTNMVPSILRCLPYQVEIENRIIYGFWCEECLGNNADDI
jgi:hypothetical protein